MIKIIFVCVKIAAASAGTVSDCWLFVASCGGQAPYCNMEGVENLMSGILNVHSHIICNNAGISNKKIRSLQLAVGIGERCQQPLVMHTVQMTIKKHHIVWTTKLIPCRMYK